MAKLVILQDQPIELPNEDGIDEATAVFMQKGSKQLKAQPDQNTGDLTVGLIRALPVNVRHDQLRIYLDPAEFGAISSNGDFRLEIWHNGEVVSKPNVGLS